MDDETWTYPGGAKPDGLPPMPPVSQKTMLLAGLVADVYGLDEAAAQPGVRAVSCLWLIHGRGGRRTNMADFGSRAVAAWAERQRQGDGGGGGPAAGRGLVAVALDQRNHGSRLVDAARNQSWRAGNPSHGVDMFASIVGMVGDVRALMGVVGAYLFPGARGPVVDDHLVLGHSLGGHCAWQLAVLEERARAVVVTVGCADYMCKSPHPHLLIVSHRWH